MAPRGLAESAATVHFEDEEACEEHQKEEESKANRGGDFVITDAGKVVVNKGSSDDALNDSEYAEESTCMSLTTGADFDLDYTESALEWNSGARLARAYCTMALWRSDQPIRFQERRVRL